MRSLFFALFVMVTTNVVAQKSYVVEYDYAKGEWRYFKKTKADEGERSRALKHAPVFFEGDNIEVIVKNVNPTRVEVGFDASDFDESWDDESGGMNAFGEDEDNLLWDDVENLLGNNNNGFERAAIPTAPMMQLLGATRGAAGASVSVPEGLSVAEKEVYMTYYGEFSRNLEEFKSLVFDFQRNVFAAADLMEIEAEKVKQAMAGGALDEATRQRLLDDAKAAATRLEELIHVEAMAANLQELERAHVQLGWLGAEQDFDQNLGAAWAWLVQTKAKLGFQEKEGNGQGLVEDWRSFQRVVGELEALDLTQTFEFEIAGIDEDGGDLVLEFQSFSSDFLDPEATWMETGDPRFNQVWYHPGLFWSGYQVEEGACEGCMPVLRAEGYHFGLPENDPEVAVQSEAACGTWRFFDVKGMLVREVNLSPCEVQVAEDVPEVFYEEHNEIREVVHLRAQRRIQAKSGLQAIAVSPFVPRLSYYIEEDNLNGTFMIRGVEKPGAIPAVGTSLVFEGEKGRHVRPGLAFGLAYGLEEGSDLNVTLGPTLRLTNLPELSFTCGLAYTRLQRLQGRYDLDTAYPSGGDGGWGGGYDYERFLLEERFEFGLYFGLVLRN
jgi:hypothetical protein